MADGHIHSAEGQARAKLSDEHRALLADPEVAQRFEALMAECLAERPRYGACGRNPFWVADSVGFTIDAGRMTERAASDVRIVREHAEAAKIDALIVVELQIDGVRGVTTLDGLCDEHGLDWGERDGIRATLAAGHPYEQDRQGGWSKLPKRAVVRAAALLARAA